MAVLSFNIGNFLIFRQSTNTSPKGGNASNRLVFIQSIVGDNRNRSALNQLRFYQKVIADARLQNLQVGNTLLFQQKAARLLTLKLFQIWFPFQIPAPSAYFGNPSIPAQILGFKQIASAVVSKLGPNTLTFTQSATYVKAAINQSPGNTLIFKQGAVQYNPNFNACKVDFVPVPALDNQ